MSVAIIKKSATNLFPLTSPPSKPEPDPDPATVARVLSFDDREIVILYPVPDTVTLSASVTNEMMLVPDQSGKSVTSIYGEIDLDMRAHLASVPLSSGGPVDLVKRPVKLIAGKPSPVGALFSIEVAPGHHAYLSLNRKAGLEIPSWTLRLEFSASKAGPEGLKKIEDGFELAVGALDFEEVPKAFAVARLDVAVDCVGAEPLDLLARIPKPGKRLVYFGNHGRPETIYFYERKKPLKKANGKTYGPTRLRMYERRAERLQRGFKPPFGDCPVTRLEIPTPWKKGRPRLSALGEIPNRFADRFVAYASGIETPNKRGWRDFCLKRFAAGPPWIGFPISTGIAFYKAYKSFSGDVLCPDDWQGWTRGLSITGLDKWIDRASG